MESLDTRTLDDETAKLLPVDFCLELVNNALIGATPPTAKQIDDALRMLDIVVRQRPGLRPRVRYLKAVGLTHGKDYDAAAAELSDLLDPEQDPGPTRDAVLFPAWDLALRLHPELVQRLGGGRGWRSPAGGSKRSPPSSGTWRPSPNDPAAVALKREARTPRLQRVRVRGRRRERPAAGRSTTTTSSNSASHLLDDADPAQVDRGLAYLRMAGRGLPAAAPAIFQQLAHAAEQLGRHDEAAGYLGQVKRQRPDRRPAAT